MALWSSQAFPVSSSTMVSYTESPLSRYSCQVEGSSVMQTLNSEGRRFLSYTNKWFSSLRALKNLDSQTLVFLAWDSVISYSQSVNEQQKQDLISCFWSINVWKIAILSLFRIDHSWFIQLYMHSDANWKKKNTLNHVAPRVDLSDREIVQCRRRAVSILDSVYVP